MKKIYELLIFAPLFIPTTIDIQGQEKKHKLSPFLINSIFQIPSFSHKIRKDKECIVKQQVYSLCSHELFLY